MKADREQLRQTLSTKDTRIEAQEIAAKKNRQEIDVKDRVITDERVENAQLKADKDDLLRELAEAKKMLAKSQGHSVMKQKINHQKKVTRDALSLVAEIRRDRSIFCTPQKAS